jgi:hypothetical protein
MYASSPQSGALALRANLRANLARSRRKLAQRPDMMRWDSCRRGLGDGDMDQKFAAQDFSPARSQMAALDARQAAAQQTPKPNGLVEFFETPIGDTDFTYGHVAAGFGGLALLVALMSGRRR